MTNSMHPLNSPMNQGDKLLDPQLWHACAGGMAQMPLINSKVIYFPQGHAEYASRVVDFGGLPRIPPLIPCRVSDIKYLADAETDEVYAKFRLIPLKRDESEVDDESSLLGFHKEEKEKTNSFAKTLTQSDANNGGGFSVPRYCAETIFPRLDYSAEPPVQTILVKDVHGEIWKFRHIYRGTPRRHLLTTGWSNFVNQKKLVAGDSIVFLRAENGDLCVGIRRAKKGIGGGPDVISTGWNTGAANCAASLYRGFPGFLSENGNLSIGNAKKGNDKDEFVLKEKRAESVVEAATLAASGRPFEAVYFPRASIPEFVVKASSVKAAMKVQWCAGMRFKMAFETEDSSRISWFMGTISSVHIEDPVHWPTSPWRLLQVAWDEPDLLQSVKRVNPWLVELVSNPPAIYHSRFSPPRKRPRIPSEFPAMHLSVPQFLGNHYSSSSPFSSLHVNVSTGIQGARHTQFGLSTSNLHSKKLQMGLQLLDPERIGNQVVEKENLDAVQCTLKLGTSTPENESKTPIFVLFGQPILTEQQISHSRYADKGSISTDINPENTANASNGSGSAVIQDYLPEASSDGEFPLPNYEKLGHCKVFIESEDIGRSLDLSTLGSYEDLSKKLTTMFCLEQPDSTYTLVYSDSTGSSKHIGDEHFSDFAKKARRLTILMDSSNDNLGN